MPGNHKFEDKLKEDVANVMSIAGVQEQTDASNPITIPGVAESHNPLDIPFGYEVDETVSVPGSASAIKIGDVNVDNTHNGKKQLDRMSENVVKQLLETQLGECPCKNKARTNVSK